MMMALLLTNSIMDYVSRKNHIMELTQKDMTTESVLNNKDNTEAEKYMKISNVIHK